MNQLEQHGYISCSLNPDNRRHNLVSVDSKALEMTCSLIFSLEKRLKIFIKDFSEEEGVTIFNLIDRMLVNTKVALHE